MALISGCAPAPRQPVEEPPRANQILVDVGGHSLEAVVAGEGVPAVVFEAGMIGGIDRLRDLQDAVAEQTLTVAYERAGLGGSEPGPEPRSASQIAQELSQLLRELDITGPIVVVGHSAGGLFARVFAYQFPDRIAGLVLVDPATEDAYENWRTTDPDHWAGFEEEVRRKYNPPAGWYGQWRALPNSMDEARAAWPLPEVPVAVFTALVPLPDEWMLADDSRIQVWLETHRMLVAGIPDAKHVVVDSAHHGSILDHPDLIRTILEMVEAARDGA
jgi:pimeloyl-ACP methyl ester carboxylesterase